MLIQVPVQWQRDPRWRGDRLGNANFDEGTIGQYGCAITTLSMLLTATGLPGATPLAVNSLLLSNDGFNGAWGTEVLWPKLSLLTFVYRYDCPDFPASETALNMIDEYLGKNIPVVAMVDASREAGLQKHFVLIVGKDDQGYIINDPWSGDQVHLCPKYGVAAPIAICGLRFYKEKTE